MKTSELTDLALDWAVTKCLLPDGWPDAEIVLGAETDYSSNWALGGPIIEREGITISRGYGGKYWWAVHDANELEVLGPTPLVAAMRAYVTAKLGDEVDVPAELMEAA